MTNYTNFIFSFNLIVREETGGSCMVTFFLNSRNATQVVYKYYPENHTDKACGFINVDLVSGEFSVKVVAEKDFVCKTSVDELNEMRNAINEMRVENGEPPLTEDELPIATEGNEWYYYADYVIRRLVEDFDKGIIPEKGTVAWY